MKWKEGVTVTKNQDDGYLLKSVNQELAVLPEHSYLIDAIKDGMEDDLALIAYIMEKEGLDEVPSRFELAGFLIEYRNFIAEDTSHYEII